MNLDIMIYITIALLLGVFVGIAIMRRHFHSKIIGNLRVDQSDPDDNPFLFLEIENGDVETIRKEKYAMLRVRNENYIPQK